MDESYYESFSFTDVEMVDIQLPMKRIKLENESVVKQGPVPKTITESELYIKLHLAVLHSLRAGRRTHGPPTAVNAQNLVGLTPHVQAYAHSLLKRGVKLQNDEKLQVHICKYLFEYGWSQPSFDIWIRHTLLQ